MTKEIFNETKNDSQEIKEAQSGHTIAILVLGRDGELCMWFAINVVIRIQVKRLHAGWSEKSAADTAG